MFTLLSQAKNTLHQHKHEGKSTHNNILFFRVKSSSYNNRRTKTFFAVCCCFEIDSIFMIDSNKWKHRWTTSTSMKRRRMSKPFAEKKKIRHIHEYVPSIFLYIYFKYPVAFIITVTTY